MFHTKLKVYAVAQVFFSLTLFLSEIPPPGPIQFPSVETNSVTVSWSPPVGATGSYRYKVTWKGGQNKLRMVVAVCEVEVTGLLPAEKYHFTVSSLSEDDHQSTCVEASVCTGEDHIVFNFCVCSVNHA